MQISGVLTDNVQQEEYIVHTLFYLDDVQLFIFIWGLNARPHTCKACIQVLKKVLAQFLFNISISSQSTFSRNSKCNFISNNYFQDFFPKEQIFRYSYRTKKWVTMLDNGCVNFFEYYSHFSLQLQMKTCTSELYAMQHFKW